MEATSITIDPERVFLFTRGKQIGPLQVDAARSYWEKQGSPQESWFWSPGMEDWIPVAQIFQNGTARERSPLILAVDDDPVMIEILRITLENADHDFILADDMLPACRLLEERGLQAFDCVVTDYNMPGGSGLDLVRWIKQRDDSLQTLLLTARDDKQLVKEGLRAGIFDFLEKPLITDQFIATIKNAIKKTHQRRDERAAFLEMVRFRLSGEGSLAEEVITNIASREAETGTIMRKLDAIIDMSRNLEDTGQLPSQMSGELGAITMLDLVQLFHQAGKTGCLRIYPDVKRSTSSSSTEMIYFRSGHIYHTVSRESEGIEALRQLLRFQQGNFTFFINEVTERHTIVGEPMSLILMISAEMDEETNRIKSQL